MVLMHLRPILGSLALALVAVAAWACGGGGERAAGLAEPSIPAAGAREARPSVPVTPAASARRRIVFLGDSLTAGLGLEPEEAVPALIQARLDAEGYPYEAVNAGVSGDTSAGGLSRLDWSLEGDVAVLVVELGGNDGLRGLPVSQLRQNLTEIITRAKKRGITVVLTGMEAPPNYGADYTSEFRKVFPDLAREHQLPFVPFFLEGVAGIADLNQRDGIHPNPAGARIVAETVWRVLEPRLDAQDR
jgi:acyl-CoA thioesterase-1